MDNLFTPLMLCSLRPLPATRLVRALYLAGWPKPSFLKCLSLFLPALVLCLPFTWSVDMWLLRNVPREGFEFHTLLGPMVWQDPRFSLIITIRAPHDSRSSDPFLGLLLQWHKESKVTRWLSQLPPPLKFCCILGESLPPWNLKLLDQQHLQL